MTRMIWSNASKDSDLVVSKNNYRNSTTVVRYKPIKIDKPIVEKTYFEQKIISASSITDCFVGVVIEDASISWAVTITNSKKATMYRGNGTVWKDGVSVATSLATWAIGDVIGVAVDPSLKKVSFYKNNTLVTTVDYFSETAKSVVGVSAIYTEGNVDGFFDADKLNYSPPSGYKPYGRILNKILLLSDDGKSKEIQAVDKNKNIVPAMTSKVLPSGIVTSSSQTGSNHDWHVFDKTLMGNGWLSAGRANQWISYEYIRGVKIAKYTISATYSVANASPKNWSFEGSNDGGNTWHVLNTQTNIAVWESGVKKEFTIEKTKVGTYKTYRIFVSENNGHSIYISINEIEMMEDYAIVTNVPINSFINHGMSQSDLASIDMSTEFTEKHYIQDTSIVLGSGKVFEQALDMNKVLKKISIN